MLLSLILASCAATADSSHLTSPSQAPEGFWDHWGDGLSEISAYSLSQPRYGQDNPGEVVLIFVTETFTHEQRVKSDGGHRDAFPVMKLNAVRDFQTGFYDYNVMTSTFVPLSGETPRGIPTKQSFSMQEWCGSTYAELTSVHDYGDPVDGLRLIGHGYFDGESVVDKRIPAPVGGITADALPILVRGVAGPLLQPGASMTVPFLPRLADSRMLHRPLVWTEATLTRSSETKTTTVPAGAFETFSITMAPAGGPAITYDVEVEAPHRIIGWQREDGEAARMTGSTRSAYWRQQRPGEEARRSALGLPAPSWP